MRPLRPIWRQRLVYVEENTRFPIDSLHVSVFTISYHTHSTMKYIHIIYNKCNTVGFLFTHTHDKKQYSLLLNSLLIATTPNQSMAFPHSTGTTVLELAN